MRFTRTKVIILNGTPQSGKDTFAKLAQDYCNNDESANVLNLSSVDPIKDVLEGFGWCGDKTDTVRDIISNIKKIWIDAQNGPTTFMLYNILEWHKQHIEEDNIVFCHIREPEEIDKLKNIISGMESIGIEVMTVLIVRCNTDGCDVDNVRDSDNPKLISQYSYDEIIYNNGDLASYDERVCEFINKLLDEEE